MINNVLCEKNINLNGLQWCGRSISNSYISKCDAVSATVYGESCAVLRHNCPCVVTLLLSWDCPFKRLFSSQEYICVCLIICSPLKEPHSFNKYVKALRVKMTKRVQKTNKSPEDQQESGRLPRARTRNMKTQGHLQESGSRQESKKIAKSQESRSTRVWRTGTI